MDQILTQSLSDKDVPIKNTPGFHAWCLEKASNDNELKAVLDKDMWTMIRAVDNPDVRINVSPKGKTLLHDLHRQYLAWKASNP